MKPILTFTFLTLLIAMLKSESVSLKNKDNTSTSISENKQKTEHEEESVYWINRNYAICIAKGKAPCDCLSENEIVMLYFDPYYSNTSIYVQSSVFYFGLETSSEFNYIINSKNKDGLIELIIPKEFPLKDSIKIIVSDGLYLTYKGKNIQFEKRILKTLDKPVSEKAIFSRLSDMWMQLNTFSASSLLNYPVTFKSDSSKVFFTYEELEHLIADNKISISCSDDYHYNSMMIKGKPNQYFHLEFKGDKVILYNEKEGRNRGEKVNLNKLDKQILYRER